MFYILVSSGHFVFATGIQWTQWIKLDPTETDKRKLTDERRLEKNKAKKTLPLQKYVIR